MSSTLLKVTFSTDLSGVVVSAWHPGLLGYVRESGAIADVCMLNVLGTSGTCQAVWFVMTSTPVCFHYPTAEADVPVTLYKMDTKTSTRMVRTSDIPIASRACPFSILHYWRPRLGCFPDAMHTIGGIIKDLLRMLMAKHMKNSRLSAVLVQYLLERNDLDVREAKPWEAGKCL